ncbi:MAG TPA: dihydrodipicolinate synthase family protein, partial [Gaiellales bacterium]
DLAAAKAQDAALHDLYTALAVTTNPIPVKAALNLLGHDVGGLRLPLVEADADQTATVAAALEAAGIRSAANV